MNKTSNARRGLLLAAAALPFASLAQGPSKVLVEVWKDPSCGCCKDWVAHMEANGFQVKVHDSGTMTATSPTQSIDLNVDGTTVWGGTIPSNIEAVNATNTRFVDMTSHGPNRLFGIANKGRIAVGYDADLTIVDLKARRTITHEAMATRAGWTPFDGMEAKGWPMATIIRGRVVMRDRRMLTVDEPALQRELGALMGADSDVKIARAAAAHQGGAVGSPQ